MEQLKFTLPSGAKLTAWLHTANPEMPNEICRKRPALLICPGGAYCMTSYRENESVALAYLNMGLQVFVLEYSVEDQAKNKQAMEDLARSVRLVRANSDDWDVDPGKVLVMGFSAGGHLAASLCVHWDDPEIAERVGAASARELRPDGAILCYPVITMGSFTHEISKERVMRETKESEAYWSLETQVNEDTPPTFIWHTMDDDCVPVENSLFYISALRKAMVSCEAHLFRSGPHGASVCTKEVDSYSNANRIWVELTRNWLDEQFGPLGGC